MFAFEPIPETFECLVENTKSFPNIHVFNQAVGDLNQGVSVGVGKMFHHPGMETVIAYEGNTRMVRIDDLGLSTVDFVKIDVEGFELRVLKGAKRTLKRDHPIVLFEENIRGPLEHNIPNGRCREFLESLGASLLSVQDEDFVFGWKEITTPA